MSATWACSCGGVTYRRRVRVSGYRTEVITRSEFDHTDCDDERYHPARTVTCEACGKKHPNPELKATP